MSGDENNPKNVRSGTGELPVSREELMRVMSQMDDSTREALLKSKGLMGKSGGSMPDSFESVFGSENLNLYVKGTTVNYQPEVLNIPNYIVVGDKNPPIVGSNGQLQDAPYPYKVENVAIPTQQLRTSQQTLEVGAELRPAGSDLLQLSGYVRGEQALSPEVQGYFANARNYFFNGIINTPEVSEHKLSVGVGAEANVSVFRANANVEGYSYKGTYGSEKGVATALGAGLAFPKAEDRKYSPFEFYVGGEIKTYFAGAGAPFTPSTVQFGNGISDAISVTTQQGLQNQINQNAVETIRDIYYNNNRPDIPKGSILPTEVRLDNVSTGSLVAPTFKLKAEATAHLARQDFTLGVETTFRGDVEQIASPGANGLPVTAVNTMNGRAFTQITAKIRF